MNFLKAISVFALALITSGSVLAMKQYKVIASVDAEETYGIAIYGNWLVAGYSEFTITDIRRNKVIGFISPSITSDGPCKTAKVLGATAKYLLINCTYSNYVNGHAEDSQSYFLADLEQLSQSKKMDGNDLIKLSISEPESTEWGPVFIENTSEGMVFASLKYNPMKYSFWLAKLDVEKKQITAKKSLFEFSSNFGWNQIFDLDVFIHPMSGLIVSDQYSWSPLKGLKVCRSGTQLAYGKSSATNATGEFYFPMVWNNRNRTTGFYKLDDCYQSNGQYEFNFSYPKVALADGSSVEVRSVNGDFRVGSKFYGHTLNAEFPGFQSMSVEIETNRATLSTDILYRILPSDIAIFGEQQANGSIRKYLKDLSTNEEVSIGHDIDLQRALLNGKLCSNSSLFVVTGSGKVVLVSSASEFDYGMKCGYIR